MSTRADCARLHRLIDCHLRRYTETDLISVTKENETDLLISLSQVLREIQCLIEFDSDSGADAVEHLVNDKESVVCPEEHLTKIVADFVGLLHLTSPYVQHLAGNILVEISEFLAEAGSHWYAFIRMLCDCTELTVKNILSYSTSSSATGSKVNSGISSSNTVLETKMENAQWSTLAGTFRVLRNILKHLRQEEEDLLVVFFKFVGSTLVIIPWCLLDEKCFYQNGDAKDNYQVLTEHEPRIIFLGNFIQFLCSLVQQNSSLGDSDSSKIASPILSKIIDLVPNLLKWCLPKQENLENTYISRYLRHKILALMIRLSSQSDLECTTLVSWLQLLHLYFQELLEQPLGKPGLSRDDCLDGSPFLSSFSNGKISDTTSISKHLQRLAVFLLLRCSLSLISSTQYTNRQCECHNREKGLQDLSEWIKGQIPSYRFSDHEIDIGKSIEFSTSVVQLYMHEDDLLFKILLQLLYVPFCGEEMIEGENLSSQDEDRAIFFHVSTFLNPIYLFHIFLSELQYDHQVLLDYLISKDIGISCAEYLLRCLRKVCETWNLFVKFPSAESVLDMISSKKRRVLPDGLDFETSLSSSTSVSSEQQSENHRQQGHAFEDARNCLLSLKCSIESLHRKNLFPYNPEVLLNRLSRFQELCFNQDSFSIHKEQKGTY